MDKTQSQSHKSYYPDTHITTTTTSIGMFSFCIVEHYTVCELVAGIGLNHPQKKRTKKKL